MEDDKLKDIFDGYNPELSSSFQFMRKLERNMESVEIIKRHDAALKRRNKIAVAISGLCGFAMGVILTLILPLIENRISSMSILLPFINISRLTVDYGFVAWIVIAAASVLTAINAYEASMAIISHKEGV
ncbi:MAG: odorant receptor [Muribaculaceae bacterium]|nr:odorant receptor [Muribaculaceae bacterium]